MAGGRTFCGALRPPCCPRQRPGSVPSPCQWHWGAYRVCGFAAAMLRAAVVGLRRGLRPRLQAARGRRACQRPLTGVRRYTCRPFSSPLRSEKVITSDHELRQRSGDGRSLEPALLGSAFGRKLRLATPIWEADSRREVPVRMLGCAVVDALLAYGLICAGTACTRAASRIHVTGAEWGVCALLADLSRRCRREWRGL